MDRNVGNVSLGIEPYPSKRERERGVGRCFEGPDASMSGIGEMTQPAFTKELRVCALETTRWIGGGAGLLWRGTRQTALVDGIAVNAACGANAGADRGVRQLE